MKNPVATNGHHHASVYHNQDGTTRLLITGDYDHLEAQRNKLKPDTPGATVARCYALTFDGDDAINIANAILTETEAEA
jgi:hypothetical protein